MLLLNRSNKKVLYLLIWVLPFLSSCQKQTGKVFISFVFPMENKTDSLVLDTCYYINAAGNQYVVTDVQYFISNVILTCTDGTQVPLISDKGAHYVDAKIPSTLQWHPTDEIPVGKYQSITFTFGLSPELNHSFLYPNAPENAMSWPTNLGGGYHYMKINGWWIDEENIRQPFNLHTGIGQQRDSIGNITGFVHNNFAVTLPLNEFRIEEGNLSGIKLQMHVNRWFSNPYIFDFNIFGGSIMQNQEAQEILKANGKDVFSCAF